jgi:hypothetical protein
MIDAITNERIEVNGQALTGSNIVVPVAQLDLVTAALARHNVKFWVRDQRITIDDDPPVAIVSFSRTSDTAAIQTLLDTL